MPASFRRHRKLYLSALLLFLVSSYACGQATVLVVAAGSAQNETLSTVVGHSASIQLESEGLVATVASGPTGSVDTASGRAKLEKQAAETHEDFLLIAAYTATAQQLSLDLALREAKNGRLVGQYSATLPFDLNLDFRISDAVRRLLAVPGVKAAIEKAASAHPRSKVAQERGPQKGPSGAGAGGAAAPTGNREPGAVSSSAPSQKGRPWRFAFGLRGEPLLLVGNASSYFRYGADASLFAGVRFPVQSVSLEGGAMTAAAQLFPAAGSSEGKVYAFLGGAELRLGTPDRYPVHLGLRTAAGAAIILAEPAGAASEAKTDIFARGGVGASFKLLGDVKVGVELGALVIFEQVYPIVAFAPALTVGF